MARITSQEAAKMVGGQFELVLVGAQRARELARGSAPRVIGKNGIVVTAIKEIEQGKYTKEEYKENMAKRR